MDRTPERPTDRPRAGADERAAAPALVRVGGSSPITPAWIALAAGVVAMLVVKPWGGGDTTTTAPHPSTVAQAAIASIAAPASSPPRSAGEIIADDCRAPSGWRIYTTERWRGQTVRIWWAIEPVAATSPADPRIPYLSIVAEDVPALGYCAPLYGPGRPPDNATVRLWAANTDGTVAELHPRRVQPPFESSLVALYAPPGASGDRIDPTITWPTGRYLFSTTSHWFGVDLRITPRLPQGAGTGAAPPNPP